MPAFGERLEFLRGPGGMRAAAWFALKVFARVDVFRLVWVATRSACDTVLPPGWRHVEVHTLEAWRALSAEVAGQAASQCGASPERLAGTGASLHLLLAGEALAAQLTVQRGPLCRVDSPALRVGMADTDAWLGYLYTWPGFRRQGAAQRLIALAACSAGKRGIERLFAHVRATNVPSLAAFERAGWRSGAALACTPGGRLLMAPGAARLGLDIRQDR